MAAVGSASDRPSSTSEWPSSFIPATKAHPALRLASVDALDALASSLAESGVEITWADDLEIPGQRRFHASDPWGNRLEFLAAD